MTRGKKLLILLSVLVITAVCVVLVIHFAGGGSDKKSTELSVIDTADIQSISWVYNGDTYKLLPDDEGFWYIDGQKELDLESTAVTGMVSLISNFYAQKKVAEDFADESTYGFDKSELTVTVKTAESEKSFTLGNFNETAGYYYLKSSDSPVLWYVDSQLRSSFCVDSLDLVEQEHIPAASVEYKDVGLITVKSDGVKYTIKPVSVDDDVLFTLEDSDIELDQDIVHEMIDIFKNIPWASTEAVDVRSDDLDKYGLDLPLVSFAMTYTYETDDTESETGSDGEYPKKRITETSELLIGTETPREHENDDRIVYAMLSGGKNVYTLKQSSAESFTINYPEALYDLTIIKPDTSNITELNVRFKGNTYNITSKEAKTEGSESLNVEYYLNSNVIDLNEFIDLLGSFDAISVSDEDIKNPGDELISFTLKDLNGHTQSVTIYEMPSDNSSAAVSVDGKINRTADYIKCDNISDAFRDALAGIS